MTGLALAEGLRSTWRPLTDEEERPGAWWTAFPSVAAATFVLLLSRRLDFIQRPAFWAEDGVVFFCDQLTLGAGALLEPYAGYLHTVPRLLAAALSLLPFAWAPLGYTLVATAISALCCAWVTRAEFRRAVLGDGARALLAVWLACMPTGTETVGNLTNLQWHLVWWSFLVVAGPAPRTRGGAAAAMTCLVLVGASAPGVLALVPLLAARAAVTRRSSYLWVAVGWVALVGLAWWSGRPGPEPAIEVPIVKGVARLLGRFAMEPFVGEQDPFALVHHLRDRVPAFCGVVVVCASVVAWRVRSARPWIAQAWAFVACYAVVVSLGRPTLLDYLSKVRIGGGGRYFVPTASVVGLLLVMAASIPRPHRIWAAVCVGALLTPAAVRSFACPDASDDAWPSCAAALEQARQDRGTTSVTIPARPDGWAVTVQFKAGRPSR